MSYYYDYYIGYRTIDKDTKEEKLYPLGPFDTFGKWHSAISRSASFASDLYQDFYPVTDALAAPELLKALHQCSDDGEDKIPAISELYYKVNYLPIDELPSGNYIKRGYFLINDVKRYEEVCSEIGYAPADFDGFYDHMSPTVYAAKLVNELMEKGSASGKEEKEETEEDEGYDDYDDEYKATDFMYYAYPDYGGKEYEAEVIRRAASVFEYCGLPEGAELIAIETEG